MQTNSEATYFDPEVVEKQGGLKFHHMSERLLRLLLKTQGILAVVETEESGKPIVWDEAKITRLADDFAKGERSFSMVPADKGRGGETLKTNLKTIFAHITVKNDKDEELKLRQFVQEGVAEADESGEMIPGTELYREVERKSAKSSLSGKLRVNEDESPIDGLHREMKQELKLDPDKYDIIGTPNEEHSLQYGRGFPGLLTETDSTQYQIVMHPDAYKEDGYVEDTNPILNKKTGKYALKRNIFRWEKVEREGSQV